MSEKTEKPTARKLRQARERGDVPVSTPLAQALGLVAALAILPAAARAALAAFSQLLGDALAGRALSPLELAVAVLALSLPVVLVAGVGAAALAVAQGGGVPAFQRLTPDLSRLDPIAGLRGLFARERLFGVARALVALGLVALLAALTLRAALPSLANTAGEIAPALAVAGLAARELAWSAAIVAVVLGVLDLVVVRAAWQRRSMMTRDEVRREFRESEGDPEIKAQRRRAHQEMLTSAAVHAVKDASVVIVNPTHLAIALRYDEAEDLAPRVLAQGQGDLARRILEAAHAYGVPVVRDVPIARALAELEVGDEIPEALYEAVAEILRALGEAEKPPA